MALNSVKTTSVYRYQFTKDNHYHGCYHGGELIYAYVNVKHSPYSYRYDNSDVKLSNVMLSYWSNFAKYGDPNNDNLPKWDIYDNNINKVMELGSNVGMIDDNYIDLYKIIEKYIDRI